MSRKMMFAAFVVTAFACSKTEWHHEIIDCEVTEVRITNVLATNDSDIGMFMGAYMAGNMGISPVVGAAVGASGKSEVIVANPFECLFRAKKVDGTMILVEDTQSKTMKKEKCSLLRKGDKLKLRITTDSRYIFYDWDLQ